MVNPGAFRGVRYAFLVEQKPLYANAVTGGHVADCLSDIQRRYFKRFPVDSPHDVDPPVAFLESVRDDEADPEPTAPDEDSMLPQEYRAAVKEFRSRQALIAARKDVCACLARPSTYADTIYRSKSNDGWVINITRIVRRPMARSASMTP